MMPPATGKSPADSSVQMTEIVLPEDANAKGSVFGGRVLALIDKCAAIVAMRHARTEVVTVSMDRVVFVNKVNVGQVLNLEGRINAAFGSSMEIEVTVQSENPTSGRRRLTTTALVTMVAVDGEGRPRSIPPLTAIDDDDRRRVREAGARRRQRLAERRSTG